MKIAIRTEYPNWFDCALLILACMNFGAKGSVVLLAWALWNIIRIGKLRVNFDLYCCIAISAVVILFSFTQSSWEEAIKGALYTTVYICGNTGYHHAKDKRKFIYLTILSVTLGFFAFLVLTYFYNLSYDIISGQRILYSIWTQERMSVTLVGLIACVVIGFSCWAFLFSRQRFAKILSIIGLFFILVLNLRSATRTPFVLAILVYGFVISYILFSTGKVRKTVLWYVALAIALGTLLYIGNVGGIRDYIEGSPLFARFETESLETGRVDIFFNFFKYWLDYPLGGSNIHASMGIAPHFYWQQFYDLYGAPGGLPLLVLSISVVKNIVSLLRAKRIESTNMLFVCMYSAMLIQCCVEPVFTGYPILFWALVLIHGMANAYLRDTKRGVSYA